MKIIVPCTFFLGAKKRKNFLNLNTYRNAHFIALNNAKKQYKEVIQGELDKLSAIRMIKPHYRYYLPRKCDIGNVHAVLEQFFLDALVESGYLDDDDCKRVIGADYEFIEFDKDNPRCEIIIKELA